MANCDIYISSANASGEETYELARSTYTTNTFEPLTLTITPFEGQSNFSAYNIQWMYEGDLLVSVPKAPVIQVDKPGDYRAILTLKMNPSTVCEAEVHIKATPCYIPPTPDDCGTSISIQLPNGLAEGVSIAPGDQFTVGDFLLTVTSITSGSKAGWKGKGYVTMRLPMNVEIGRFSVLFTDAVINDCYELASGKVESEYDPNWGGILDVDQTICNIKNIINDAQILILQITDEFELISCEPEVLTKYRNRINDVEALKDRINKACDISDQEKLDLIAKIDDLKNACICVLNSKCPNSSARIQIITENCSTVDILNKGNLLSNSMQNTSGNKDVDDLTGPNVGIPIICNSNGSQSIIDFGANVYTGYNPATKIWTINGNAYRIFTKYPGYELVGCYLASDVSSLEIVNYKNLTEKLSKLSGVSLGSPSASTTCPNTLIFNPNEEGDWLTDSGRRKLQEKINGLNEYGKNVEIIVSKCNDNTAKKHTISNNAIREGAVGSKDIQIKMCWDGTKWTRSIEKYHVIPNVPNGFNSNNAKEGIDYAKAQAQEALNNNTDLGNYTHPSVTKDGFKHEFNVGKLDGLEGAMYFLETGKYIVENLQVPPTSWNGESNKVLKISPIIGGGADQGLQETKDIKELVILGCEFIKAPAATASAIWDGVTRMSLEDARNTLLGDWIKRIENYERGTPYNWYQGGRDGVAAVKYIYAGGLTVLKANIQNAGEVATTLANRGWRLASRANLRNAIKELPSSRAIAEAYWEKIRNNQGDYLPEYLVDIGDKELWINNVFKNGTNAFEGHHVIPKKALESENLREILDWAEKNNRLGEFDFGGESNGIMLLKRKRGIDGDIIGDHANHPNYTDQIINQFEINASKFPKNNPEIGFENLKQFSNSLKNQLVNNVVNGDNIVNDLNIIF